MSEKKAKRVIVKSYVRTSSNGKVTRVRSHIKLVKIKVEVK